MAIVINIWKSAYKLIVICMEGTKDSKPNEKSTTNQNDTKYVIVTRTVIEEKKSLLRRASERSLFGAIAGATIGGAIDIAVTTEQLDTQVATFTIPGSDRLLQNPAVGQVINIDGLKFEIIKETSNNLTLQQLSGTSNFVGQPLKIPANGDALVLTVHNGVVTGYKYFLQNVNIHMVQGGASQFLMFGYSTSNTAPNSTFLNVSELSGKLVGAGNVLWSYLPTGFHLLELTVGTMVAAGAVTGAFSVLFKRRRKGDDEGRVQAVEEVSGSAEAKKKS